MKSKISPLAWCLFLAGFSQFVLANQVNIAETSQILTINATPNILLIPDTSESMQEGLDGRVAIDWNKCEPGPTMQARANTECVAGARSPLSKASIVKRVSRNIVQNYGITGRVNIGLLSYQQFPANTSFNSVFPTANVKGTALWRLYHRPLDVVISKNAKPNFFTEHQENWTSSKKRYRDTHPFSSTLGEHYFFYNAAIPGYERSDFIDFCRITGGAQNNNSSFPSRCYNNISLNSANNIELGNQTFNGNIFLVDSMRQRGITSFGNYLNYIPLYQNEWRSTISPGLGYLHNPIGGVSKDKDGKTTVNINHFNNILKKLEPQRIDWDGSKNPMTDPNWPLISAGLNPIEGTILTARDYFLGSNTNFKAAQGNSGNLTIPESCGINAAVWITNGLPSVAANGNPYSDNPVQAVLNARDSIKNLFDTTAKSKSLGAPVKTYVVGFALPPGLFSLFSGATGFNTDNPLDVLAVAGGTGQAYNATDEAELLRALEAIFQNIIRDSISSSGLASTATELSTDTKIFQSELNTINWSGDLLALSLASGGRDRSQPVWRAATKLAELGHNKRKIFSFYDGQGFEFKTEFTPTAVKNLFKSTSQPESPESVANNLINYIRGERTNEGSGSDKLRERSNIMGHIVNSTPLFVPGEGARPPVVYVMANDGMLHAFHANNGTELFAYLPGAILNKLPQYASATYKGEFLLDGQLAYKKVNNTLYLTGTAGTGTQAVFTLDISNPTNFGTGNIVWEVSGSNAFGGLLGRTGSQPIMATLGGKDVVLLGNGYKSAAGKSSLLAVNLQTGALEKAFTVEGSGFGSPGVLDLNRDKNPDFIYIGDFNGKVWRFALNESLATANGYSVSRHLFTSDNNRPIVVAPVAASHPDGGVMVIVGSGELITQNSRTSNVAEYVYGIYDKFDGGTEATITSSQLVSQTLTSSGQNRTASRNPVTPDKAGWRLTLPAGERMLANAVVRRQKVIFGSYKPDNTACSGGGQGYMTELALFSGTPVSLTEPASKPVAGIPRTPIFIEIPEGGFPIVTPGCTDDCDIIADNKELLLIGEQDELHNVIKGRQNWREIGR